MKAGKAGLIVAALAAQWSLADRPPAAAGLAQRSHAGARWPAPAKPAGGATANDSGPPATTISKASLIALQGPVSR